MFISISHFAFAYLAVNNFMEAPMSDNIKSILADSKKAKTLSSQILMANRLGVDPIIKVNGKTIRLVRVSPVTHGKSFTKKP